MKATGSRCVPLDHPLFGGYRSTSDVVLSSRIIEKGIRIKLHGVLTGWMGRSG